MADYSELCRRTGCKNYIDWSYMNEECESCALQGESYYIDALASECPFKSKIHKIIKEEGLQLCEK